MQHIADHCSQCLYSSTGTVHSTTIHFQYHRSCITLSHFMQDTVIHTHLVRVLTTRGKRNNNYSFALTSKVPDLSMFLFYHFHVEQVLQLIRSSTRSSRLILFYILHAFNTSRYAIAKGCVHVEACASTIASRKRTAAICLSTSTSTVLLWYIQKCVRRRGGSTLLRNPQQYGP